MRIMSPTVYRPDGLPRLWTRDPHQAFEILRAIWREREPAKINGYLVTPYVAGLVIRVYQGMMPATRKRFINRPLPQVIALALEILG